MKAIMGLVTLLYLSGAVSAVSRTIGVLEIDEVEGDKTFFSVYATDGQVYEVDANDELTLEQIILAKNNREKIAIEVTAYSNSEDILGFRSHILDVKRMSLSVDGSNNLTKTKKILYTPDLLMNDYITNFSDERRVNEVFNSQRVDTREDSQCYNRAHIWSWEMRRYTENGKLVQPGKIWIYFTKKYIRAYRFKWWFHISPYIKLNGKDVVMDKKYLSGPISTRGWTDFFIKPRTECQLIDRYSQYEKYPNNGNCFIMKTSVHYYQPYQAELLEQGRNPEQKRWENWELRQAYEDGVGSNLFPNL